MSSVFRTRIEKLPCSKRNSSDLFCIESNTRFFPFGRYLVTYNVDIWHRIIINITEPINLLLHRHKEHINQTLESICHILCDIFIFAASSMNYGPPQRINLAAHHIICSCENARDIQRVYDNIANRTREMRCRYLPMKHGSTVSTCFTRKQTTWVQRPNDVLRCIV